MTYPWNFLFFGEVIDFRLRLSKCFSFGKSRFGMVMGTYCCPQRRLHREYFMGRLKETGIAEKLLAVEKEASLIEILESWLQRLMPLTNSGQFKFLAGLPKGCARNAEMPGIELTIEKNLSLHFQNTRRMNSVGQEPYHRRNLSKSF